MLPLPWPLLAICMLIVFGAGIVRGFAGFGFSALCVAGLTLFASPAVVVPPIFVLEVLASLSLLRGALKDADWPWLSWLMLGNALFIPLGIAVLAWVPETPLRLLIGALLLGAAVMLRSGFSLALAPTRSVRLATGLVSGFVNGVAAIGGIAVAVLLSAPRPAEAGRRPRGSSKLAKPHSLDSTAQMAPAAMRGTMIVLFLFTDLYALAWAGVVSWNMPTQSGLLGHQTLLWAAWLAPAMLGGNWLGQRAFAGVSPAQFRRHVLNLLILIALISVIRALLAWTGTPG